MKLEALEKIAEGEDVFVVGTGTSLKTVHLPSLSGRVVITLNDAIKAIPDAAVHLYTDALYRRYADFRYNEETRVVCRNNSYLFQKRLHPNRKLYVFAGVDDPARARENNLFVFATVAATGIHLAKKIGARRIFLLGVDAYRLSDQRYWDGRYQSNKKKYKVIDKKDGRFMEKHHLRWQRAMETMKEYFSRLGIYGERYPGSGVFNLSPHSRIETWEKVDSTEVLNGKTQ